MKVITHVSLHCPVTDETKFGVECIFQNGPFRDIVKVVDEV